jgi:hypothetical protein
MAGTNDCVMIKCNFMAATITRAPKALRRSLHHFLCHDRYGDDDRPGPDWESLLSPIPTVSLFIVVMVVTRHEGRNCVSSCFQP